MCLAKYLVVFSKLGAASTGVCLPVIRFGHDIARCSGTDTSHAACVGTLQVKDCVAAARQGIEYQPRKITGDATTTTTADSTSSGSGGEGEKLHVSGSDGEVATNKRKLTDGQEVGAPDTSCAVDLCCLLFSSRAACSCSLGRG
jgi:hypothetical protein